MIVNETEAASVRRIFEIYLEEGSLSRTAQRLEAESIRPKTRLNRKERHVLAGRWGLASVQRILRNQTYIGLREVNAKHKDKDPNGLRAFEKYQVVQGSWTPIVDPGVFQAVQKILVENLQLERRRLSSGEKRVFFLSGIIYCDDCGRPLVGSSGHGRGGARRYYVHHAIRGEKENCAIRSLPAEELEQAAFQLLDEVIYKEGYLDGIEKLWILRLGVKAAIRKFRNGAISRIFRRLMVRSWPRFDCLLA